MAIASVARKATIRRDPTFQNALRILGQQQAISGRLALEQDKQKAAALKAERVEISKQFKTLREIDSPYSPYNEEFDRRQNEVEDALIDPNKSFVQRELALTDLSQFSKQSAVVKGAIIKNSADRVGTEEQRKFRNQDAIADAQTDYILDENNKAINPIDLDEQKLTERVDNDLKTYNIPNIVDGFMSQQKDVVATEVSSKNLSTGFSRNDIVNKAAKFLVLNDAETGYEVDPETGKPIANITGENLEAFEAFSKGNSLAIDNFLSKPGNKEKSRLEGMKDVLEKNGWLTSREEVETKIVATPKPSGPAAARGARAADARSRVKFFDDSIAEGGAKIISQLKGGGKGVVTTDGAGNTTGSKRVEGGTEFTVVVDPNKVLEVPRTFINATGEEVEFSTLKTKKGKFIVTTVVVKDDDPLTGIIELNALFDKTVPSKLKIDPVAFAAEWQAIHGNDAAVDDPFGGAFN